MGSLRSLARRDEQVDGGFEILRHIGFGHLACFNWFTVPKRDWEEARDNTVRHWESLGAYKKAESISDKYNRVSVAVWTDKRGWYWSNLRLEDVKKRENGKS